jgi:PAS domain S-box-containing protein
VGTTLYFIGALIATALGLYVLGHRWVHGARPFALAILSTAGLSITRALGLNIYDASTVSVFDQLAVMFSTIVQVAWLVFVIQYAGRGRWLTRRALVLLALIPLITAVLVWTNGLHGLVWKQDSASPDNLARFGPWFWVNTIYSYGLTLTSVWLLIGVFFATPRFYSAQSAILLVGITAPAAWDGLVLLGVIPPALPDMSPYLLILSSATLTYGLFGRRLLSIVPLGRDVFFRNATDIIIVTDIYHRVLDLNSAAERITNKLSVDAIGRPITALFPAWPELATRCEACAESTEVLSLDDPATGHFVDARLTIITGRGGNRIGHLIVLTDVTRQRSIENELRQQANYLNTLIESTGSAIITFDLEGHVTSWNKAAEVTLGWCREEVIGNYPPMISGSVHEEMSALVAELRNWGGSAQGVQTWWRRKDQELLPVLTTMSCVRDVKGDVAAILCVATDVSKQHQLEQNLVKNKRAVAIMQERTRLARELHDSTGQVLSYVRMQVYAAQQQLSRGHQEEANTMLARLVEMTEEAHTAVRDQILSLTVNLPSSVKTSDMLRVLRDYLDAFSKNASMQVEFSAEPEVEYAEMAADALPQVIRIVQEAVTNARKHATAEHLQVVLSLIDGHLHGIIRDDGRGFLLEAVNDGGVRRFGLRIMAERAQDIGGKLFVLSVPGEGTQVVFDIPCARKDLEHEAARASVEIRGLANADRDVLLTM